MRGDKILYKWSPNEIAKMNRETAEAVIEFHRRNPPTMDYFVEYNRSMTEISLAQKRIAYLKLRDAKLDPLASAIASAINELTERN